MAYQRLRVGSTQVWPTGGSVFDALVKEFGPFDLDACATRENAKAERFNDADVWVSGLAVPWIGLVYMNPPYSGRVIGKWVAKAYQSSLEGATVVCLLPVRTDTAWWHDYVMQAAEIRFLRGRGHFTNAAGERSAEPFASAIVVFRL